MIKLVCLIGSLTAVSAIASPKIASYSCSGRGIDGKEVVVKEAYLTQAEWNKKVKVQNVDVLFMFEKTKKVSASVDLNDIAVFSVGETETTLELHFPSGGVGSEGEKRICDLFCTIKKIL